MICYREDFNTSHVTVYRIAFILGNEVSVISIHPMLRFIDYGAPTMRKRFFNFNTSHVTVYQNPTLQPKGLSSFQYIPCYGLSGLVWRATFRLRDFNTSHVTVYLMILSHSYLGIFHHFLYSTSFQHFLPADYKI